MQYYLRRKVISTTKKEKITQYDMNTHKNVLV